MDFRNSNYFLANLNNCDIGSLKRYFKCKIHCKCYLFNHVLYNACVSINKKNSIYLNNYLSDRNFKYVQVYNEPKKSGSYLHFDVISGEAIYHKAHLEHITSIFDYLESMR